MADQLALRYDGRSFYGHAWDQLRKRCREIVDYVGVKQASFDLDVAASQLLHALDERERHHVRAAWIPYFIAKDPTAEVSRILAEMGGFELQPAKPVTPEEELASLKEALERCLGPDLRAAVLANAKRR